MTRLSFEVSEDVEHAVSARARDAGFNTVEDYLQSLVKADLQSEVSPELEALLVKGLASPAKEVTQSDWDARRDKLRTQFGRSK